MVISVHVCATIIFFYNGCTGKLWYYFYIVEAMTQQHKNYIMYESRKQLHKSQNVVGITELERFKQNR